ncbi:DUF2867 domain-containing protein [Paucibacter sp. DJ1R-11]|uniref:DUF2867 domain-containing protein n=1 Tax=Paucibacter sp. DJ1R-11 TaxID=2893556 RepID=UPI0021E3938A|nr:DUF2867 domain-containing protein [Paucibacter sp. DJ1R-11]MCV2365181.1 DUF2867 domain-containing protein [Paucibacter sp. DJ1R-11]
MPVVECEVPSSSVLERRVIDAAYFRDAYRVPLRQEQAGMAEIFFAIFGQLPRWLKYSLIVRNRIATFCGLEAPTRSEIMNPEIKSSYVVGEKIGVWPIFALTPNELVAGRNNKHLDFRLSVLKEVRGEHSSVVVSTICTVHKRFGKVYLFFIVPFHRWGVQQLLSRALIGGRL